MPSVSVSTVIDGALANVADPDVTEKTDGLSDKRPTVDILDDDLQRRCELLAHRLRLRVTAHDCDACWAGSA